MGYVKLGSPPAIGNVVRNTGEFSTVGVGAAAVTSAVYVNATNRIGAWITGSNISSGPDADGLFIDTSFAPSANVTNCASIGLYPTFTPPGGVTITTGYGLYVASGTQAGAGSVTTGYGLFVTHPTFGTSNFAAQIDNIRIDVNTISATDTNGTMTVISNGTGAINIGTNATAHTTTLGSTTTTATTAVQSGSGGITVATSSNGTIGINSGTGTMSISTDASATTLNIATGGAVKTTTLGSTNSTSATTIQSGSGALSITSTNGTWTGNSGTGALGLSTDATATTVSLATGAGVKLTTVGSTNGASSLTLNAGSAGLIIPSLTGVVIANGASKLTVSTLTQHGVLVGGASNAISSTAVGSTGQVLQANSSADPTYSTATYPSTAGTSGNIMKSDGTNFSSASASASGASLFLIQSQTASSSTTLSFTTGITGYTTYLFVISKLTHSASADLQLLFSVNGGSSYLATNYTSGLNWNAYNSATLNNINSTTFCPLITGAGSDTASAQIWCYNIGTASPPRITGAGFCNTAAQNIFGANTTTTGVNAFRFQPGSGNMATGVFTLFGVKET